MLPSRRQYHTPKYLTLLYVVIHILSLSFAFWSQSSMSDWISEHNVKFPESTGCHAAHQKKTMTRTEIEKLPLHSIFPHVEGGKGEQGGAALGRSIAHAASIGTEPRVGRTEARDIRFWSKSFTVGLSSTRRSVRPTNLMA